MIRKLAAAALLVGALQGGAQGQDISGCGKFKWSIERERALFAAPKPLAADGALDIGSAAYRVSLADDDKIAFPAPPERAPKPGAHGAALSFKVDAPGLYDVTLSDEGWIDVVDHGQRVASTDFSGQKGCAGVRKSVRFSLKPGDFTLQLSNVEAETINIAIAPAP